MDCPQQKHDWKEAIITQRYHYKDYCASITAGRNNKDSYLSQALIRMRYFIRV